MEKVMHNDDLRREIWSYLRKMPHKKCGKCNLICMWNADKIINKYADLGFQVYCMECFHKYIFISNTYNLFDKL